MPGQRLPTCIAIPDEDLGASLRRSRAKDAVAIPSDVVLRYEAAVDAYRAARDELVVAWVTAGGPWPGYLLPEGARRRVARSRDDAASH